jgi:hypothetical protein
MQRRDIKYRRADDEDKDDPCWEGYEMAGMKTDEDGNKVPNCIPKKESSQKVARCSKCNKLII